MNINRHNYEEFFILYMDNELCSDDRRMVEAFVRQHPDLKEELDLLLQYKLEPDTSVIFNGKEDLMKVNGSTPVTLTNYEEWLVLYIDRELTPDQRKEVEQFMAVNPSVKEELALLQHTKLQPEEIIFANKESLYRREEKVKQMPVRWWRVAALLILALGLTALLVFKNKPTAGERPIVKTAPGLENKIAPEKTNVPTTKEDLVVTPKELKTPVNETPVTNNNVKQAFTPVEKQENKNVAVKNNKPVVNDHVPVNIPTPLKKDEPVVVDINNKPSNNLPQPLINPTIKNSDASNKDVAIVNTSNKQESKIIVPVTTNTTQPSDIVNASFKDDADLNQSSGKKGKFRGFFRKVTRTFEKRTNIDATDDDRFLVAGLAIKLK